MQRIITIACLGLVAFSSWIGKAGATAIDTGTLLQEMASLNRLARWPDSTYRTIQFSSYDRRSSHSEAPGWFANADGFGGEPILGFQKVLREPRTGQAGLFLLAETNGPGAIVRGWSAGMDGVLRVYLDPAADNDGTLIYEGPAYGFLARRSAHYLKSMNLDLAPGDAFSQQDADYLPIPFAKGLKVTWEGKLNELHFYHLQVRLYSAGTVVTTFDPKTDLKTFESQMRAAVADLTKAGDQRAGEVSKLEAAIEPGKSWSWTTPAQGPGAIRELKIRLQGGNQDQALRGCLLRIAFDGSQRAQVEAPVGDFFGSGPGVNPFSSLPFTVEPDGVMICRFVMPFEKSAKLDVINYTPAPVRLEGEIRHTGWPWDERSLHFHAKWRADHDLLAGPGAIDLPYVVAIGQGLFVGCAAMIMNPSGVPTAGGNWWGEGDEKILVDGESRPSTFGTGSEDYFNYSWSRPDLFAHPYCGQPLDSGPDTSGYVSNHRFQIMDAITFDKSLAVLMELWAHNRTTGLSYARIAYFYARRGIIDDHRGLMPADLKVPPLPKREPRALGGASGVRFFFVDQLRPETSSGRWEIKPFALATQLQITSWHPAKGDLLKCQLPVEKSGRTAIHLVAVHSPEGAEVRILVDGKPVPAAGGAEAIRLRSAYAPRVLNVNLQPVDLKAGPHELAIECLAAGTVGLDYIWVKGP